MFGIMLVQKRCELLSDFVYSFFEHNTVEIIEDVTTVVNCFQILYIRSLNTICTHNGFRVGAL